MRRSRSRCRTVKPCLLALEDRFLPSTVTNLNDSGPGSLREALTITPANGQIDFQPGLSGAILLTSGPLNITQNVNIAGPGSENLAISGGDAFTVFGIASSNLAVSISRVTITDGAAAFQGGGVLNFGTLLLDRVVVVGSSAIGGGGGIYNGGTLTLFQSMITSNVAGTDINPGTGGGIMNTGILTLGKTSVLSNTTLSGGEGGGIYSTNTASITNSLVAGNASTGDGGGIWSQGMLTLLNSTINGNSAALGGGILIESSGGSAKLTNTIVALNNAGTGPDVAGAVLISTFNLIGDGAGSMGLVDGVNGNRVGTSGSPIDPLLGNFQPNGGPVFSIAILPGSPAIDAGTNTGAPQTDMRGFSRVVNGTADIGAYEHQQPATTTVVSGNPSPSDENEPVVFTATVTGNASGSNIPVGTVTFFDAAIDIGSAPLVNGIANLSVTTLSPGSHSITASYSGTTIGDYILSPSDSVAIAHFVRTASATGLSVNPGIVEVEDPVTLTATVTGSGPTPTGTVTFYYDGVNALGTVNVTSGTAILVTNAIPVGTRPITAVYNGDATYADSTSASFQMTVKPITFFAVGGAPGRVRYYNPNNTLSANFLPYGANFSDAIAVATGDVNGDGYYDLITGATVGNPHVKVFNGKAFANGTFNANNPDASLLAQWFPYALQFNVGSNIAVGDVNGDGFAEVVTGATAGNPHVKVHDGIDIANGTFSPDTSLLASFFPYALQFNVGAYVAVGDVDNDGRAEVTTGASVGNPHLKVYRGQAIASGTFNNGNPDVSLMGEWFSYALQFNVGATVAVADTDGDGFAEVITGASVGNPHVRVYSGQALATSGTDTVIDEFFAYGLNFNVGVRVGAGDFNADDRAEILTGASVGSPHYRAVPADSSGIVPPALFEAIPPDLVGGIYVGA